MLTCSLPLCKNILHGYDKNDMSLGIIYSWFCKYYLVHNQLYVVFILWNFMEFCCINVMIFHMLMIVLHLQWEIKINHCSMIVLSLCHTWIQRPQISCKTCIIIVLYNGSLNKKCNIFLFCPRMWPLIVPKLQH